MANNSVNLTSLDFDTLKTSLKTYLSTQSVFKDFDFEGSNINVLLDILSHNSYLNSFYLNMVASEMFLDSAQKWDTVVSHAKELNYVPRSSKSASANVNLSIDTTGITTLLTVPKGTIFTGTNSNGSFSYSTRSESTYTSTNTIYNIVNLKIYEGLYVNNSFIMDRSNETQIFVLNNENIDVDSLTVTVYEDNNNIGAEYFKVDNLFGLTNTSNAYFIQATHNKQYEILFGDGFLGRMPKNQALINVEYMVTNGSDSNGIKKYNLETDLGIENNGVTTLLNITTSSNSAGGSNTENIESIRFYAPRYFATQQRAVASDDYTSLVLSKFGGNINDVNVYGGQLLDPKQYGRVVICLKPTTGTIAPDYIKDEISKYLLEYISLPTRLIITNPEYIYSEITSNVKYDPNLTVKISNDIKNAVLTSIMNYSTDNLEKFGKDFRFSKLIRKIDDSDDSILSNDTSIRLLKKFYPKTNFPTTYKIEFDNVSDYNELNSQSIVESSYFTYVNSEGINYPFCKIQDIRGKLIVYNYINNIYNVVDSNIGSIDYTLGKIVLNNINISDYGNVFSIYMIPKYPNITIKNDKILLIDLNDVNITITEEIS